MAQTSNARFDPIPQTASELHALALTLTQHARLTAGGTHANRVADNTLRAAWAALCLQPFIDATFNGNADGEDYETIIGDLLANLRHLCDALGLSPDDMFERGVDHHDSEVF